MALKEWLCDEEEMDISLHESAIYGTFVEKMCYSY